MLYTKKVNKTFNSQKLLFLGWGGFIASALAIAGWTSFLPDSTNAATQVQANINKTGYYLNVTSSVGGVNMNVEPSPSGQMASAKDNVNIKTNIPTGYKLYLSATSSGTDQNSLYNTYSLPERQPDKISASSGTLAATNTLSHNTWGYGIPNTTEGLTPGNGFDATYSAPNPAAMSKWAGVPATTSGDVETYAQLVQTIDHANEPKGGNNVDVYYAVNTDTNISAGHYTGSVTYTAVADVPQPTNLTFDEAYEAFGKQKDEATNLYKMQDMEQNICNAVKNPTSTQEADTQITTLVDTRDGKTYKVGKLLDGNCWMQENLRLGSETQSYELTPDNSNVQTNWTLPNMSKNASWAGSSYDVPRLYPDDAQDSASNYYGYYYNFNAVTAGTDDGTSEREVAGDICPKGWSLPSNYPSNPDRSYSKLLNAYGVIPSITSSEYTSDGYQKMITLPLQFVLSGIYNDSGTALYGRGNYGHYWTNDRIDNTAAYYLSFSSNNISPQGGGNKGDGSVARCLAK